MKTKNLKSVIVLTAVLATAAVFSACKKEGGYTDAAAYWSDTYRQRQLNGKVKTVKTFTDGATNKCSYLEFGANGNLLKDGTLYTSDGSFSGYVFSYDSQNRITKAADVDSKGKENTTIVFGYDGSHNVYMPTNFYDLISMNFADLRLQQGVSSFRCADGSTLYVDAKCTSVSSNHLTFTGTSGSDVSDFLGGTLTNIEVDYKNNYPTDIKFMTGNTIGARETTTLGSNGLPAKLSISLNSSTESVIFEFTTIAGFLLQTKAYPVSNPTQRYEWQYNNKGYVTRMAGYNSDGSSKGEILYSYEYESQGNWTKQVLTMDTDTLTYTREYTYW